MKDSVNNNPQKGSILLIDDDESQILGYSTYFSKAGYETLSATCVNDAKEILDSRRFGAVILDLQLPDGNGIDLIEHIKEAVPEISIIVISGMGDIPTAVKAMRLGADNFMAKPVDMMELEIFLAKSMELSSLRRSQKIHQRLHKYDRPLLCKSPAAREFQELAVLMSKNESTVLIIGETGTGKGVYARWIHDNSKREKMPFVELNCSTFKDDMLASELFGHVKGAFTSAYSNRQGLIEIADGGTLFLDEISDMSMSIQAQLLKVIEEKTYRRLGESTLRTSDFRLVCATNSNLEEAVERGGFRRDLYYRINTVPLRIPPLRERLEDLPALANYFLESLGYREHEVSSEVMSTFMDYNWTGNIRELRNVLERGVILSRGNPLNQKHFEGIITSIKQFVIKPSMKKKPLNEEYLKSLISDKSRNISEVAEELGISRATLYRRLKKMKEYYDC
jgi:DNA-binding NtrC family response regulator